MTSLTPLGQEATPLVVDGVLYTSTAWSMVKAYDDASLPVLESGDCALDPPTESADEHTLSTGHALYANFCSDCHGARAHAGGVIPDLRASALLGSDAWFDVVLGGALKSQGMASFAIVLDHRQAAAIRSWVISVAQAEQGIGAAAQSP